MLPDFVLSYLKFNYFPEEWDKKRKESVAKPEPGTQPSVESRWKAKQSSPER